MAKIFIGHTTATREIFGCARSLCRCGATYFGRDKLAFALKVAAFSPDAGAGFFFDKMQAARLGTSKSTADAFTVAHTGGASYGRHHRLLSTAVIDVIIAIPAARRSMMIYDRLLQFLFFSRLNLFISILTCHLLA